MLDNPITILATLGAVLLALGIIGRIEAEKLKVGITSTRSRFVSGIVGTLCLAAAVLLHGKAFDSLITPKKTADVPDTTAVVTSVAPSNVAQQKIHGDWSGDLDIPPPQGGKLPLVLHIFPFNGTLRGTNDSPSQNFYNTQIDVIEFNDPVFKYRISPLGVRYAGKLDGDQITGTFEQNGATIPLVFKRTRP